MGEADQCDVCIVGTGAGGGILAHRLAMAGLNVVSLEQGGLLAADHFRTVAPPGSARDFGIGPRTEWPSDPHDSLFIHPLFADGKEGSTERPSGGFRHFQVLNVDGLQTLWNGVSVRFSRADFDGWPIDYEALDSHYAAVEQRITVCGTRENIPELPDGIFVPPKPLRPPDDLVVRAVKSLGEPYSHAIPNRKAIDTRAGVEGACVSTGICTSGCPVGAVYKFSARLLPELRLRPNYELRTHAKVVRLVRADGTRAISAVEYVDTRTGARRSLRAKVVVLATGAVETPRILFNSADAASPGGLGNDNGRVGLALQDNPKAVLSTSLWKLWGQRRTYDIGYGDLLILMSRGRLPDGSSFPFIGHGIHGIPDVPHYLAGMAHFPPAMKRAMARTMFYSYVTLGLFCAGEVVPGNRVRPGRTQDRYGVRHVDVDFEATDTGRQRMEAMLGWGRKVLRRASSTLVHASVDNSGTGIHYAGTTPMSADPLAGTVDADLRAHDVDNLYICDGGVIPYLPDKHLTLTIMALSDRLGDHLIARARAGGMTH
ncbi:GMC family oxidoreductase [Azorhizobium oxalatiphilum]|uniref:GMC family oxidoreductase n=1 Tax=Azorhizobium oxalatiphilum TaxID=980631 RepID=A0A917C852_9HYPH|nr:GMC family oxidoreductase [Azorhizobium oxalatiphilum]GGF75206.1 GMC family oxidoreductase [Azorhizobium oxalatiphilum]